MTLVCGYKGDPVCEPPDCSGACPTDKPDLRPERSKVKLSLYPMQTTTVVLDKDKGGQTYEDCHPTFSKGGELVIVKNDDPKERAVTTYAKDEWHSFFTVRHDA